MILSDTDEIIHSQSTRGTSAYALDKAHNSVNHGKEIADWRKITPTQ